jgi:ATP-binding cassette, subfamily B, bacterial
LAQFLIYIRSYLLQVLGVLALAILAAVTSLTFPLVTKYVIDVAIPELDMQLFLLLLALQLGMSTLNLLTVSCSDYLHNKLCYSVTRDIRLSVFETLTHAPLGVFESKKTGDLIQRINQDVEIIQNLICSGLLGLITNSLTLVALAAILIWLNAEMFLVALVVLPLFLLNIKFFSGKIKETAEKMQEKRSGILSFLVERFKNIKLIHNYNAHTSEKEHYGRGIQDLIGASLLYRLYRVFSGSTSSFMISCLSLLVWAWGGSQIMAGAMTLGSLIAFTQYLSRFYTPVRVIHEIYMEFVRAGVSMRRVAELMHFPQVSSGRQLFSFSGDIAFVGVGFGYDQKPVFAGLDLRFEKGVKCALVGSSGCGKSTLAQLLANFYQPQTGSIRIDGRNVQEFSLKQLRANIEIVPQEPQFLHISIADNIRYARPEASDREVRRAAEVVGLANDPQGVPALTQVIGEQGGEMSGGERQRIAIARALLKNPQILVIDEALSALDAASEALIIDKISEAYLYITLIIITHRFSTLGTVDEIVCLDGGRVAERGSRGELTKGGGIFYRLFEKQIHAYEAAS